MKNICYLIQKCLLLFCFFNLSPFIANALIIDLELIYTTSTVGVVNLGDPVEFEIDIRNWGPLTATDVAVEALIPSSCMNFISANAEQGTYDVSQGEWIVGSIAPNEIISLNLTLSPTQLGTCKLFAQISNHNETDIDSQPNNDDGDQSEDDEDTTMIFDLGGGQQIDLELDLSTSLDSIQNGQLIFTVDIESLGGDDASGVEVEFILPGQYQFVAASESAGIYDAVSGIWNIGNIIAGDAEQLVVYATFSSTTPTNLFAEVINANEGDIDSVPNNDDGDQSEDDEAAIYNFAPEYIDLELSVTSDSQIAQIGDVVNFTIEITNSGTIEATDIITVVYPSSSTISFINDIPSQGTFNSTTNLWLVGNLAPNETAQIVITYVIQSDGFLGLISQILSVNETDIDSSPNNDDGDQNEDDEDSLSFQCSCEELSDLEILISANSSTVAVGDTLNLTIEIENNGPDYAYDVVVGYYMPNEFSFINNIPSQGFFDINTGHWTIGTLWVGQIESLDIQLIANSSFSTLVKHIAEVSNSDTKDPDSTPNNDDGDQSEDDEDSVTIDITNYYIDLELTQSINSNWFYLGDTIEYTVELINKGPNSASDIQVLTELTETVEFIEALVNKGSLDATSEIWNISNLAVNETATVTYTYVNNDPNNNFAYFLLSSSVQSANENDIDSIPGNEIMNGEDDQVFMFPLTYEMCENFLLHLDINTNEIMAEIGDTIAFDISINNNSNGLSFAEYFDNIAINLNTTNQIDIINISSTNGIYTDSLAVWQIDSLASNQFETLTIEAVINSNYSGTANISAQLISGGVCDIYTYPESYLNNTINQHYSELLIHENYENNRIYTRVFLEGYHKGITGAQEISSTGFNLIPLNQPFNTAPWNYSGTEAVTQVPVNAVDWILLACRDANGNVLEYKAGFVDVNGYLIDENGEYGLAVSNPYNHFSLHHKGHLAVMSNKAYENSLFDFTSFVFSAYGLEQLKSNNNAFVMYAGDYDNNGIINNLDFNAWENNSAAVNQYLHFDADGNGIINNLDYNFWELNRSKVGALEIQY